MTKSRKEILEINPVFTKFMLDMQLLYKPEPFEEGDRVDCESFNLSGDSNGVAILTKEQANNLNQEQFEEFERNRDENPFANPINIDVIENRLIISSKENPIDYINDIANAIEQIRIELNDSDMLILGVGNIPWLYQENDYEPVKKALDYLKVRIDNTFNGGFILREESIIEFIPHLFWLTRCNASMTHFYLSYTNAKTIIGICKYGVMHFMFYDETERLKILNLLSTHNFKELDECGDPVEFDNFDGRRIVL